MGYTSIWVRASPYISIDTVLHTSIDVNIIMRIWVCGYVYEHEYEFMNMSMSIWDWVHEYMSTGERVY